MRLPVKNFLPLAALIVLAGCGSVNSKVASAPPPASGPAADYPMVIGDPFTVEGTTYTPADKLNFDEVGYASIGDAGGESVSAAHKTLPMPSYVEVTSLDSGKTILARVERRGPMSNDHVIELSSGAATQLGIVGAVKAPVRVRRVNPPEQERAMLRAGEHAPERMTTPKGLLAVLMRKLDKQEPLVAPSAAAVAASEPAPAPAPLPKPSPASATKPERTAKAAAKGNFAVQVASFSTEERANRAAGKLNGKVVKGGRYWLTRLGPFADRADASAALAKAKAAGYSDARIQRAD